jgi:hypothetical protein
MKNYEEGLKELNEQYLELIARRKVSEANKAIEDFAAAHELDAEEVFQELSI